ncbi:MAG: site-specific integrase [Clostridia bacterium]|nr:site-specific integrase [Clostridia bacterium]
MKNRKIGNITKLKDNKYKIRISAGFDDFGKRKVISKTISCSSDTEAEKYLIKLYNEKDFFKSSSNPKYLKDLIDVFMANHAKNLSLNTIDYYNTLNKHLVNFHYLKIENLNIININKILDSLPDGKIKQSVFKFLKTVINKNITWGYFKNINPCNMITTPKYKPKEKSILNINDIDKINALIINEEFKYQCIFYFAVLLGLRRGEIIALKWNDIDFKNKTVSINKSATLSHNSNEDYVVLKETKTVSSVRVLSLPNILADILRKLKQEQNINILKLGDLYVNNNFIFTTWNGKIMNLHTPTNWWRDFTKKHNLSNVTLHGLRHTCCSLMLKEGNDIATISKTLGHSNISTTLNIYSHMIEDNKKKAIESVASYFIAK